MSGSFFSFYSANEPPSDKQCIFTTDTLAFYPCSKEINRHKIIGIVVTIALATFLAIASFYSATVSFAIINTCFLTILATVISYTLISPPGIPQADHFVPKKRRISRSLSLPPNGLAEKFHLPFLRPRNEESRLPSILKRAQGVSCIIKPNITLRK